MFLLPFERIRFIHQMSLIFFLPHLTENIKFFWNSDKSPLLYILRDNLFFLNNKKNQAFSCKWLFQHFLILRYLWYSPEFLYYQISSTQNNQVLLTTASCGYRDLIFHIVLDYDDHLLGSIDEAYWKPKLLIWRKYTLIILEEQQTTSIH